MANMKLHKGWLTPLATAALVTIGPLTPPAGGFVHSYGVGPEPGRATYAERGDVGHASPRPQRDEKRRSAYEWPGDAPYSVPKDKLDAARECRLPNKVERTSEPVLLVHGFAVTPEINWEWNYWQLLPELGLRTCWVRIPQSALGDNQISAEYVARAVEIMNSKWKSEIDVVGYSEGGMMSRWAIKWFPSAVHVDDFVSVVSPQHGTVVADSISSSFTRCVPGCWQMRTDSKFTRALNAGEETPGRLSYTSIYTEFDELVQPAESGALKGAVNILLQDLCPARPVGHNSAAGDAVTFELVLDALTHAGPARPARMPGDLCTKTTIARAPERPYPPVQWTDSRITEREPPLRPYVVF